MEKTKGVTRKKSPMIRVCCLPEEKKLIEENAKLVGLSTSTYLRNVGMGIQVRGVIDQQAVIALSKVNADQGRLGGLLKMWLTNDERLEVFNKDQVEASIREALERIQTLQDAMFEVVKKL